MATRRKTHRWAWELYWLSVLAWGNRAIVKATNKIIEQGQEDRPPTAVKPHPKTSNLKDGQTGLGRALTSLVVSGGGL